MKGRNEEINPKVAICIPAYNSEAFISRTIACARNQSYNNIEILISVDLSTDKTAEICLNEARNDDRIQVIVQNRNLGWSQNVNVLLDAVNCAYYFIYFHDDILEPLYTENLLEILLNHPEAASVHCDLLEFGLDDAIKPAHAYLGNTLERLVEFMMTQKGTTLRSLIRKNKETHYLRFPNIPGDNHWTAYVFHMRLLALGPALALNKILYKRWQRKGSLTRSEGWQDKTLSDLLLGQKESMGFSTEIIFRFIQNDEERRIAIYCLKLFQYLFLRQEQIRLKSNENISQHINTAVSLEDKPLLFNLIRPEILTLILRTEQNLKVIESTITTLPSQEKKQSIPI